VFEAFFEALAALSATTHLVQMFNSPIVRAHVPLADMYENITDESAERTFRVRSRAYLLLAII
jgi:hypothetical protein